MSASRATIIAVDLGASSARVIAGTLARGRLSLRVAHRLEHAPRMTEGALRWDWARLVGGVHEGLARAAAEAEGPVAAVSCASWAQDFGLLDARGRLLAEPVSYRDARTAGMPASYAHIISPDDLVRRVGSTAAPIITLCQLRALAEREPETLARAARLLHIADLVHHELCGAQVTDRTMATASGLRALATGAWDTDLLAALGIPARILPEVADGAAIIGAVDAERAPYPALAGVPIIAGAGHDTAAASALCTDERHAFLSCGTWSMLGVLSAQPIIPEAPARDGFAILGMAGGRWSLMRPLAGLWPLQQCRERWGGEAGWGAIVAAASEVEDAVLVDLDAICALPPDDVPDAVAAQCGAEEPPAIAAALLRGLACEHALGLEALERATGRRCTAVRMVGGGSANALLCRWTAQATGRPVIAGPTEATAAGVIVTAALGLGLVGAREVAPLLERSFAPVRYEPEGEADAELLARYRELKGGGGR